MNHFDRFDEHFVPVDVIFDHLHDWFFLLILMVTFDRFDDHFDDHFDHCNFDLSISSQFLSQPFSLSFRTGFLSASRALERPAC